MTFSGRQVLNGLDLFSGIGGLALALESWVRPIAYCENDRFAQAVLLSRMGSGQLHVAPIWDDVRTLRGSYFMDRGTSAIDIIVGGFPCQDISSTGNKAGLEKGKKSSLFFEVVRLISDIRPQFIFLENVSDISVRGLDRVLLELAALGYDADWTTVSAAEIGANQIRERWFLFANLESERGEEGGLPKREMPANTISYLPTEYDGWDIWKDPEPLLGGKVHGISARVDRIRTLGNTAIPRQAQEAFIRLTGINA